MAAKRKYVVLVGLAYPLNPDAPREEWTWVEAAVGDIVDNLPERSVASLLRRDKIAPASRKRATGDDAGEED